MHEVRSAGDATSVAGQPVEDEELASRSSARLLISGLTEEGVQMLARRIHMSGPRADSPFVHTRAAEFPVGTTALREFCIHFLTAADGGSVLISAIEEMPASVQGTLMALLQRLEAEGVPSGAVRLISGTTVSLMERVTAGMFSAPLFYRLNMIHLNMGDTLAAVEDGARSRQVV